MRVNAPNHQLGRNQSGFAASLERGEDCARLFDRKYDYRNSVLPRKREGGCIHDRKIFGNGFIMCQFLVARRGRIAFRVRRIDSIHLRRFHNKVAGKLGAAQGRPSIGRKEGIAGAAGQNHDPAFAKMMQGRLARIGLAEGGHRQGGKGSCRLALFFDRIFEGERVHHRRQHADRIGTGAFDTLVGAFDTAKKIPASDDDRDLDAARRRALQIRRDPGERILVKTMTLRAHQGFAGELDDNAPPRQILDGNLVLPGSLIGSPF